MGKLSVVLVLLDLARQLTTLRRRTSEPGAARSAELLS